ncbi:TauD/TfdA family dioxygenase [Nocardia tengchongensis]|uniref:TauD/TfdA family dioxygenase n=1 Tax=Nocardia tengchongensis TaxID=2055889 RepID=A0ABX8CTS2_9NOCA|nr:TauD/TfdA family dioxygenase [Nocardia tengchongensis]QVI23299.1 TauD/TfdA family dioxygenase [Nocardia tengchongensis]
MTDADPVRSPAAWRGADFTDSAEWATVLTDTQRDEIAAAARTAAAAGLTAGTLRRDDFPLPGLAELLHDWAFTLSQGRAFVLIRRFPIDLLAAAETELAYVGLGLHLGTPVSQNAAGDLLGHVRDERVPRTGPAVRLYTTNERQDFHTDGSDLVGLLCLETARSGGESRIASSLAVYNHILGHRPDLIDVLRQPFHWDRNDEQSTGETPYFTLPAIHDIDGTPRIFYIGWYIRDAQRHPGVPPLTAQQLEAMRMLEDTANDPAFYLPMEFAPGDVQILNNAKILHSREAYTDHEDPARRRHLLRLWLTAHAFATVEDFLREGIPRRQD